MKLAVRYLRTALLPLAELFWIPAIVLLAGRQLFLLSGYNEAREWQLYYSYAGIIAACFLLVLSWQVVSWRWPTLQRAQPVLDSLKLLLVLSCVVILIPAAAKKPPIPDFLFFLPLTAAGAVWLTRSLQPATASRETLWGHRIVAFCMLTLGLFCGLKIYFYSSQIAELHNTALWHRLGLMAMLLAMFIWALGKRCTSPGNTTNVFWQGGFFLLIWAALWLVYSLMWADSLDYVASHHWLAMTTPAIFLRQGGTLMWDTPQLYGPGLTWLLAHLPAKMVWNNLFYLYVTLQSLATAITVLALWKLAAFMMPPSRLLKIAYFLLYPLALSLLAAGALVSFDFLHTFTNYSLYLTPSASAIRFIWPVLLLVWCYRIHRRQRLGRSMHRVQQFTGLGLYLCAIVWAFESALFASAVFIPAYGLFRLADLQARHERRILIYAKNLGQSLLHIVLAVALMLLAFTAYYIFILKLSPQWSSYYDFALGFKGGYGVTALNWHGRLQFMLAVSLSLFMLVPYLFTQCRYNLSVTAFHLSTALFLFILGAYTIVRGPDGVFTSLSPYVLLTLCLSTLALRHYPSLILAQLVVRSLLIATCASLLYGMAGLHPAHLPRAIFNYPPGDISRYQIQNPSLEQAVSGLGELPITVMEPQRMNNIRYTEPLKPWLPLISHMFFERTGPLSGAQYNRYYERYIARDCQPEGWLVTATDLVEFPHLQRFLGKHYTLEDTRVHGGWRLYKYKRRIACKAK